MTASAILDAAEEWSEAEGPRLTMDLASVIGWTAKQQFAARVVARHKYTLYGGARGGGKSYFLRWLAVAMLLYWAGSGHRNVQVGIFCEDYPSLTARQINKAKVEFDRIPGLGYWRMTPYPVFQLAERFGGGRIVFRNLDKVKTATDSKHQSDEYAAIFIDELTRNTIDKFNVLRGSLRWPGIEDTKFVAASNPGSIGHAWVKDIWVDGTFKLAETRPLLTGRRKSDFAYVKATAYDNPHNAKDYLLELESMSGRMRKAFLLGDWSVFEGQAFDEWGDRIHVVANRLLSPREGWRYVAGMDWGMRKGWLGLFAIHPRGMVEGVWEFAPGTDPTQPGFTRLHGYQAARTIAHRWRSFPKPDVILADDQMWQDQGLKKGQSIASEFIRGLADAYGSLEAAPKLLPAVKGPGSRKIKYDLMHQYLAWGGEYREQMTHLALREGATDVTYDDLLPWFRPRLTFQERCSYAVSTIPALPIAPDKPEEDVDTDSPDDHAYDGTCNVILDMPAPEKDEPPLPDPERHPGLKKAGKRGATRVRKFNAVERESDGPPTPYRMPRYGRTRPVPIED